MTTRFKPSRAGVINLWDYVDEEFVFADGRLVLRGHNGSGKTKALEVLFPFILDGVADARRLDPFSGDNRTMKSNLLYRGQESEHGYVWMEFARPAETVTLVIGLRAHRHRDGVVTSFFVTGKRLGVDFGLLSVEGRPLTERQLKEALEPGSYARTATDYRELIDNRLFGLGRERYAQLLDLLLALRRPLLAKDLDPSKVSATLTAGLSPVDEDLVSQAARDFENLAAVQKLFDDLTAADGAVRAFIDHYTDYLRVHARFQLDRVQARSASAVEHAAEIVAASAESGRAASAHAQAVLAREAAVEEAARLAGRLAGLKDDDAYKAQGDLERLRQQVAVDGQQLDKERQRLAAAQQHLAEIHSETSAVASRLTAAQAAAARQSAALASAAAAAGIGGAADTFLTEASSADEALLSVRARATARRDDLARVRAVLAEVTRAQDDRARAEALAAKAAAAVGECATACQAADAALSDARTFAQADLHTWSLRWEELCSELEEARGDFHSGLREALSAAGEPGAPSLAEVFGELSDDYRTSAISALASLKDKHAAAGSALDRLTLERSQVAAERDDAPPASPLRTASREDRAGAPFWQLVRFAPGVSEAEAAALEGALSGSGLLTAWVHPSQDLTFSAVTAGEADAYLVPGGPVMGRTLADVLVPEDQKLVDPAIVAALLGSIEVTSGGHDHGGVAVGTDGAFSLGVLVGSARKDKPEFIGATYRTQRRTQRLAECDTDIARLTREQAEVGAEVTRLEALLADLSLAKKELPGTEPVLKALETVARRSTLLGSCREALAEAGRAHDTAIAEAEAKTRRLRTLTAEHSIHAPDNGSARTSSGTFSREGADATPVTGVTRVLAEVAGAVEDFVAAGEQLHRERAAAAAAEHDLEGRRGTVLRLEAQIEDDVTALAEKEHVYGAAKELLAARTEALGSSLQEILDQIAVAERELKDVEAERSRQDVLAGAEHDARVKAEAGLEHGGKALTEAMDVLFEQAVAFGPFAQPALREIVGVTLETLWPEQWSSPAAAGAQAAAALVGGADPAVAVRAVLPPAAVEIMDAFEVATKGGRAVTEGLRKTTRERMSEALKEFSDALEACEEDYRLDLDAGEVVTVQIVDVEGRSPVSAFAQRIAGRALEQGALLDARERTVLEDELLSGLAQQIHDRVTIARELVKGMDSDTKSRPMSTGTTVGIRWVRSDKITDRQRAVADLLKKPVATEGLGTLRSHLREMIREYRVAHPRASYQEILAGVVDYRTWFEFQLRLADPHGDEVTLTRAKHSQMSGGEKSAAIHLPLFAAANALYSSASGTCPRMIALDEAFAGIDDRYKPELLGLTVKFDLDMFMTGHDLWASYASVPMAAHYDMHSDKASHTVSTMLVLWDGRELLDADATFSGNDHLATELLGIKPTRRHALEDGLLAEL